MLAGLYPLFDVVVLLVLLHLAFTTAVRQPAFWLLAGMLLALLAGDVGYALIGIDGRLAGPYWLDTPFLVAYALFGAAALHPSMAALGDAQPRPVQAWSVGRLALIVPALVAVPALMLLRPPVTGAERAASALVLAALTAMLVVRAVGAVNAAARTQRVLEHQATHDPLTGLANRRLLLEAVTGMLRRTADGGGRVCLLFLDLDGFKLVNDSWGHGYGDELLVQVADRLRAPAYQWAFVARVGGDEFVLAATTSPDDPAGVALAERVLGDFDVPFRLSAGEVTTAPSIGIAIADSPRSTAEDLIRDADIAMYRAKANGRNRYVLFDVTMRKTVRARAETERALRGAVDGGQLSLHYQPIVDLRSGQVDGYEALLRWRHPELGYVSPAEFIPLAEDTGLVVGIGEWALRTAIAQVAAWHAEPPNAPGGRAGLVMAVNVSARQLRGESFAETVDQLLRSSGVPPGSLHLEITESAMMEDPKAAARTLAALRDLGVVLSLDDFGTGYSALSYLTRFPVGVVKVDRGFVARPAPGRRGNRACRGRHGARTRPRRRRRGRGNHRPARYPPHARCRPRPGLALRSPAARLPTNDRLGLPGNRRRHPRRRVPEPFPATLGKLVGVVDLLVEDRHADARAG